MADERAAMARAERCPEGVVPMPGRSPVRLNLRPAWENHAEAPEPIRRRAADRLLGRLRDGLPIRDAMFDSVLPVELAKQSRLHWTPVRVARRAAELLVTEPRARILDVGSGAGKFCIVGALTTPGSFVGVERREDLARKAAEVARTFGELDVTFLEGDMSDLDWGEFDGIYLFNPFYENLLWTRGGKAERQAREARFERHVAVARERLERVRPGTRVVTYHGFGGEIPDCFDLLLREARASGEIELWERN